MRHFEQVSNLVLTFNFLNQHQKLDHVVKANALRLPHSEFFNDLLHNNEIGKSGQMQVVDVVAEFLFCLLTKCPKEDFGTKEWSVNETTPWWIGSERAHL